MKVLIIYATKYGTSEKCAKLLKDKINGEVELVNISKNSEVDLSKYDKVVIGGPIYMGTMQNKITEFCNANIEALKNKKIALFACSMFGGEKGEENMRNSFPNNLKNTAVSMKLFGGELNIDKMKFMDKFITKMVKKATLQSDQIVNEGLLVDNINKLAEDINNC
jgi:menaquinone-dependent protoporphyrinogen oxidase